MIFLSVEPSTSREFLLVHVRSSSKCNKLNDIPNRRSGRKQFHLDLIDTRRLYANDGFNGIAQKDLSRVGSVLWYVPCIAPDLALFPILWYGTRNEKYGIVSPNIPKSSF